MKEMREKMNIHLNVSSHEKKMGHTGLILGYLTEPGSLNRAFCLTEKALFFG